MGNFYSGEPITTPVPGAPPGSECIGPLANWNDGTCHEDFNNAGCGYDGGDCCSSTWGIGSPFGRNLPTLTNTCFDPYAEENGGLKLQVYATDKNAIEVTISGAQPFSNVVVWVSPNINPFVIPDDNNFCPGLEVDLEFGQLVPESFIADSYGKVNVKDFDSRGHDNDYRVDPVERCSNLFQAVEIAEDSSCKKSNIAFIHEWRPGLWEYDTCGDHGFEWCSTFVCDEPPEYNNCCQDPIFWCDVAAGCSADHNGTPDGTEGPDVCRAYWLANDYFLDVSGLTASPTVQQLGV